MVYRGSSRKLSELSAQSQITEAEAIQREHRKTSYHLIASKNKLPKDPEESSDYLYSYLTSTRLPSDKTSHELAIQTAKKKLILELAKNGGSVETDRFSEILDELVKLHDPSKFDARKLPSQPKKVAMKIDKKKGFMLEPHLEGMWISLSQPKYFDCLGFNKEGDPMYTLGRMSFDMFRPTQLVCSIRGTLNSIKVVHSKERREIIEHAPKSLRKELERGEGILRTYKIITAFAVEPWNSSLGEKSPNRSLQHPLEGLMTTSSYVLANPEKPDRLSIWFTGGSIEMNNNGCDSDRDMELWCNLFRDAPQRGFREKFRMFGARVAMGASIPDGMESDGKMSYHLNRPIGGHKVAFVDLLYLDETLRIVRASSGSVHVMVRVPSLSNE